jgi:hypothetical protein
MPFKKTVKKFSTNQPIATKEIRAVQSNALIIGPSPFTQRKTNNIIDMTVITAENPTDCNMVHPPIIVFRYT